VIIETNENLGKAYRFIMSSNSTPEHVVFDFDRDLMGSKGTGGNTGSIPRGSMSGGSSSNSLSFNRSRRFKHPTAAFFHIAFKVAAFVAYLFGGLFQGFLPTFVALILLVSMDFWTVKNVTGRLLVGLRWWNFIDDEGNSHWIYENRAAKMQEKQANRGQDDDDDDLMDSMVGGDDDELDDEPFGTTKRKRKSTKTADAQLFWTALIVTPILWFILMLISLFRLNIQWFMLVCLALVLSTSNLYGYIRCRFGSNIQIKSTLTQYVGKQIFYNILSSGSREGNKSGGGVGFPSA